MRCTLLTIVSSHSPPRKKFRRCSRDGYSNGAQLVILFAYDISMGEMMTSNHFPLHHSVTSRTLEGFVMSSSYGF